MPGEMEPVPRNGTGSYAAAFLAASIGLLTLAIVQILSEYSTRIKDVVFDLGKAWIPQAEGIGPYSGKETLMLVAWLGSWLLLHFVLRDRDPPVRTWFGITLATLFVATILMWPPVWHLLLD